jgi:single-strand DNA-binding protein
VIPRFGGALTMLDGRGGGGGEAGAGGADEEMAGATSGGGGGGGGGRPASRAGKAELDDDIPF